MDHGPWTMAGLGHGLAAWVGDFVYLRHIYARLLERGEQRAHRMRGTCSDRVRCGSIELIELSVQR